MIFNIGPFKIKLAKFVVYGFRLTKDGNQLAELREEMTDLIFWLDETENVLRGTVNPADLETATQLLKRVKVRNLII